MGKKSKWEVKNETLEAKIRKLQAKIENTMNSRFLTKGAKLARVAKLKAKQKELELDMEMNSNNERLHNLDEAIEELKLSWTKAIGDEEKQIEADLEALVAARDLCRKEGVERIASERKANADYKQAVKQTIRGHKSAEAITKKEIGNVIKGVSVDGKTAVDSPKGYTRNVGASDLGKTGDNRPKLGASGVTPVKREYNSVDYWQNLAGIMERNNIQNPVLQRDADTVLIANRQKVAEQKIEAVAARIGMLKTAKANAEKDGKIADAKSLESQIAQLENDLTSWVKEKNGAEKDYKRLMGEHVETDEEIAAREEAEKQARIESQKEEIDDRLYEIELEKIKKSTELDEKEEALKNMKSAIAPILTAIESYEKVIESNQAVEEGIAKWKADKTATEKLEETKLDDILDALGKASEAVRLAGVLKNEKDATKLEDAKKEFAALVGEKDHSKVTGKEAGRFINAQKGLLIKAIKGSGVDYLTYMDDKGNLVQLSIDEITKKDEKTKKDVISLSDLKKIVESAKTKKGDIVTKIEAEVTNLETKRVIPKISEKEYEDYKNSDTVKAITILEKRKEAIRSDITDLDEEKRQLEERKASLEPKPQVQPKLFGMDAIRESLEKSGLGMDEIEKTMRTLENEVREQTDRETNIAPDPTI